MEVSNPRDDRAERNRGSAEVPLSTVIPRVGNFHLEKNTILDSFSCTTTPKSGLFQGFAYFFSLGENTWVRCNFITQAKSVAISVWCARNILLCYSLAIVFLSLEASLIHQTLCLITCNNLLDLKPWHSRL